MNSEELFNQATKKMISEEIEYCYSDIESNREVGFEEAFEDCRNRWEEVVKKIQTMINLELLEEETGKALIKEARKEQNKAESYVIENF